jgi:hypothetical protein
MAQLFAPRLPPLELFLQNYPELHLFDFLFQLPKMMRYAATNASSEINDCSLATR